ncbi:MAG: adenine deaminase [Anaerolineales bacterium]|jgi:adenine deaminase
MEIRELTDRSKNLVDIAMGRSPSDILIKNGRWVNVQSGEILPNTDIAISGERIAFVGDDASHTIGEHTIVIQAHDRYLVPGLLDGHMHVESGMLTVTEFVRAVIPHGTTAMFIDPHEIANVFGLKGVKLMVDEAAQQPIHVWVQMPSCVPSAPGLETPGASIGPEQVAEAMTWAGIIGLGEMMNFPGVFNSDEKMHAEMAQTIAAGKIIGGHYASPDLGLPFHGYAAGGPQDDHEGTRKEDAVSRVRQGMKAMLRFGSAWHDVAEGVKAITEAGLEPRNFILCTDDSHSETLVNDGHVNLAVQQAINYGIPPLTAIQMATINTAEHFGVWRDIGMIAPGRFADILLISDLENFKPETVIARGQILVENRKTRFELPLFHYPNWALQSIHLGHPLHKVDFKLAAPSKEKVLANVIGVIENQAPTRRLQIELPVVNEEIKIDIERDINKIALVERHKGNGGVTVGLVTGFGFNAPCAVGSTVAHDSHHMIVVGTSESDMARAVDELIRIGGGQVVVKNGEIIGEVDLPIAGLMSSERADVVAKKARTVLDGFKSCGCTLNNPNMQLSLLALVVIPELRISDLGLVDVNKFDFVPVIEG